MSPRNSRRPEEGTGKQPSPTRVLSVCSFVGMVVFMLTFTLPSLYQATLMQTLSDCTSGALWGDPPTISYTTYKPPAVEPFYVEPFFQDLHHKVDAVSPEERCAAFGVKPHIEPSPSRIFYGTLLANENMEVLKALAIEAYGIFDVMAFVEANTTFIATPRTMHFKDTPEADLLQYSNMFGNETKVFMDYWLHDWPALTHLHREAEQRDTISKVWKKAGMTERDVGLVVDVDEIVSRDFLRALQVCDFPQLQVEESPSCQAPKILASTIPFESSPYCINKKTWFHPDVILGQCVKGIGNPAERVTPLRDFQGRYGQRSDKYGGFQGPDKYPPHVIQSQKFPLWTGNDIRIVAGSSGPLANYKDTPGHGSNAAYGVAFHLHNWFTDLEVLRNKYATYGHPVANAESIKLSDIGGDLDMVVRCARGITKQTGEVEWYEHDGNIKEFWKNHGGPKPLYFMNQTWSEERHVWLQEIVAKDEAHYGSKYPSTP